METLVVNKYFNYLGLLFVFFSIYILYNILDFEKKIFSIRYFQTIKFFKIIYTPYTVIRGIILL